MGTLFSPYDQVISKNDEILRKRRVSKIHEKEKNGKTKEEEEEVIFGGMVFWNAKDCKLKVIRGKRISLRVSKYDGPYNYRFFYTLVLESGKEITTLPGTSESFVLHRYREEL